MAWTTPTTRSTNDLITASIWNTDLVNNLLALKAPPTASYTFTGPYSTTSTSEVDVDTTNLSLTITTTGGDVLVCWLGTVHMSTSGNCTLNVTMDGANLLSIGNVGQFTQTNLMTVGFTALKTPVAAGAHTFKLRWKVSAGQQANMGSGMFWVREVS